MAVPMVLKYPELTALKFTLSLRSVYRFPLMTTLLFQPLPLTGTMNACAADWTPGRAASRVVTSPNTAGNCSCAMPVRRRSRLAMRSRPG